LEERADHTRYIRDIGSDSVSFILLNRYKEEYYKKDPFLKEFRKKAHSARSNSLFTLTDFMTIEEYSQTEFGKFMQDFNLGYFATITTAAVSGFPVYSILVHKTINEPDFSEKEVELLILIARAFTDSYILYREYMKMKNTTDMICQYMDTFNYGFAIVDDTGNVASYNSSYIFFASRITNKKDIYFINNDLLKLIEEKLDMPLLEITRPVTLEFGAFHIKLSPNSAIADKNVTRHVYINIYDTAQPQTGLIASKESAGAQPSSQAMDKGKFTNREYEIIELMLQGCNNQEIANKLYISIFTVKTHIKNIFNKLDVSTRVAAIAKLQELS